MQSWMITSALLALPCSGCGVSHQVVDKPGEITLGRALTSTVDAIYDAREESLARSRQNNGLTLGINICSLTAVYNISATGTDVHTVNGSITAAPNVLLSATVGGSSTGTLAANRGNQVTVTFNSAACTPGDVFGSKAPGDVVLLQREIVAARDGDPDPIVYQEPSKVALVTKKSKNMSNSKSQTVKSAPPASAAVSSSAITPAATSDATPKIVSPSTTPGGNGSGGGGTVTEPSNTSDRRGLNQPALHGSDQGTFQQINPPAVSK